MPLPLLLLLLLLLSVLQGGIASHDLCHNCQPGACAVSARRTCVCEDGVKTTFSGRVDAAFPSGHVSYGIVLDTVDSSDGLDIVRSQIVSFLPLFFKQNSGAFRNLVIVGFNNKGVVASGVATTLAAAKQLMQQLPVTRGAKCQKGAALAAVQKAAELSEQGSVLHLFTDSGVTDGSLLSDLVLLLQQKQTMLHVFTTQTKCGEDEELKSLSSDTGGIVFRASSSAAEVTSVYFTITVSLSPVFFKAMPHKWRQLHWLALSVATGACDCSHYELFDHMCRVHGRNASAPCPPGLQQTTLVRLACTDQKCSCTRRTKAAVGIAVLSSSSKSSQMAGLVAAAARRIVLHNTHFASVTFRTVHSISDTYRPSHSQLLLFTDTGCGAGEGDNGRLRRLAERKGRCTIFCLGPSSKCAGCQRFGEIVHVTSQLQLQMTLRYIRLAVSGCGRPSLKHLPRDLNELNMRLAIKPNCWLEALTTCLKA